MTETVKNRIMIFGPKAAGGKAARAGDAPAQWSRQYAMLGLPI